MRRYIIILAVFITGIELGILYSNWRNPSADAPPEPPCAAQTDSASIATEPKSEIQFLDPGVLRSTIHGWIHVRWKKVEGAKSYQVRVIDATGVEVKNFSTFKSFSYLKGLNVNPKLKETPYTVFVTPIREDDQKGMESPGKKVAMMPLKNLAPPTIKSITTED